MPEFKTNADEVSGRSNCSRAIYRYEETETTCGWRVRIRNGPLRASKSFLDSQHGGSGGAFTAAREYRDTVERQHLHDRSPRTTLQTDAAPRKNNSSGHPGVYLRRGFWTAKWNEDGVQKAKCFSVLQMGAPAAKAAAIEYREQQVQRLTIAVLRQFGNEDMTGITRQDGRWWLRLGYKDGKPGMQRSFPDRRHGGMSGALRVAIRWRDHSQHATDASSGRQARYMRQGFSNDVTTELYEFVTERVRQKTEAYNLRSVKSDVEREEIVQEVLLAYASKPSHEITDVRHYINTLVKAVAESRCQVKAERLYKSPTWVDEHRDDD